MAPTKRSLTSPIYERQDDEGDEAWAAFRHYRDAGLGRSLEATRQATGYAPATLRNLEEWSSEWSWVRRTVEWDRHLDSKRRAAAERKVVEMAERHAAMAEDIQVGLAPFFKALAEKSGKTPAELVEMPALALSMLIKELGPTLKVAVEVERKARGMEDLTVSVTGSLVVSDLRAAFRERAERARQMGDGMHVPAKAGPPTGDDAGAEPVVPEHGSTDAQEAPSAGEDVPAEVPQDTDGAERGSGIEYG